MHSPLTKKAAGLVVLRLGSNMLPPRPAEADEPAVAALLDELPFAGLILFNGRWPETRDTLARLQAHSEAGLLVTTDMERGLGQQVAGATVFPHLMAYGEAGDLDAVRAFAAAGAREALACGVHVALAPVADVNRNPRNPIIATRAFGADPQHVARMVGAYVEGARAEGLLTTAKHFPGHGGTHQDSHAELPLVADDRAVWEEQDRPPFDAAVRAGAELVMTAHLAYPALDHLGLPATRSRPILTDVLRGEMGFTGAVVTDSLHMAGIEDAARSEADVAVEVVAAGADLLLDAKDPVAVAEGLARAVMEERLSEARLDEALARVEALREGLRARFGPDVFRTPPHPVVTVATPEHQALADNAATAAIEILEGPLPDLGDGAGTLVVLVKPSPRPGEPEEMPLGEAVRRYLPRASYRELEPADESEDAPFDALMVEAREAERLVVAMVVKPAAWRAFGLAARERRVVESLVAMRPTVLAALGSPRGLEGYTGAVATLCAYSDVPASQWAVAAALGGAGMGEREGGG
ncbi:MAG TPA: glycoside hydrolase family 3 N-terminal domain-containing protein [Rhodothermales bacterium]|nr:glycoside hydrolase family 3 N-terminal domain-containing protein [Rhodothermales bacterium]